jgi:hypothetical protein
MRTSLRTSVVAVAAALTIFGSTFAAEAAQWHGGGGHPAAHGWHGGGYAHNGNWGRGGYGGYGGGYWAPGAVLGLGVLAAGAAASQCYQSVPSYDPNGNVIGYQTVNRCY